MHQPTTYAIRSLTRPNGDWIFSVGLDHEGQSAISGVYENDVLLLIFRPDGRLFEVRKRVFNAHRDSEPQPEQPSQEELQQICREQIRTEAMIVVQPFSTGHHFIQLVGEWEVPATELPTEPGKAHHSLWWGCEYWLDIEGNLVRVAREHPNKARCEIFVQLRTADLTADRLESIIAEYCSFCAQLGTFRPGKFVGVVRYSDFVSFHVDEIPGFYWAEWAEDLHNQLRDQDLSDRLRLLVRTSYHFVDGGVADSVLEVQWPKGHKGPVDIDRWD